MLREEKVYADLDTLSRAASDEAIRVISAAAAKGRCTVSLAGGRTPERMYALWAEKYRDSLPWDRVHLFWGDERFVGPDDPKSNYRMVRQALLERVPLPEANVHPILTNFPSAAEAAQAYEKSLRAFFNNQLPSLDLVLLGCGGEGHTASLFPDMPELQEKDRWVLAVRAPIQPPARISFTMPVLNSAKNVFFLAAGAEKREILQLMQADPEKAARTLPAAMVRPANGRVVWFLDQAAKGGTAAAGT
ncbi:MAG: 6-phosphogluconolactonase [Candidatus Acidiferrales bacterium]